MAELHLQRKGQAHAQPLGSSLGLPVHKSALCATKTASQGEVTSATLAEVTRTRVKVGPSAVVTWFHYPPRELVWTPDFPGQNSAVLASRSCFLR